MLKKDDMSFLDRKTVSDKVNLYSVLLTIFAMTFIMELTSYIGFFDLTIDGIIFVDEDLDAIVFTGLLGLINIILLVVFFLKYRKYNSLLKNIPVDSILENNDSEVLDNCNDDEKEEKEKKEDEVKDDEERKNQENDDEGKDDAESEFFNHKSSEINLNDADEIIATIEKLGNLKSKGFITEEEFCLKKDELLKRI